MVTQTKLILKSYPFNNPRIKEETILNFSEIKYNHKLGEEVFRFKEYLKTSLILESNNKNDYIKVEAYNSDEPITVKNGEEIILSPGKDVEGMLVPGYYTIELCIDDTKYNGMYLVLPNTMDMEELLEMRNILDDIFKGLSSNIFHERSGRESALNSDLYVDINIYNYLQNNSRDIVNSLNSILNNPIEDLVKKYSLNEYSKRPDLKSIKWKDKHPTSNMGRKQFNEKRSTPTLDTFENKLVKSLIEEMYRLLCDVEKKINQYIRVLNGKILLLDDRVAALKIQYEKCKSNGNMKDKRKEILGDINLLSNEINGYCEKNNILKSDIKTINLSKNRMKSFLDVEWIRNISPLKGSLNPSLRLLKRNDYSYIYSVYLDILKRESKNNVGKAFPSKKTSLLYEIYNVVIIKNMLEELGFQWTDGWLKSVNDLASFNGDLQSGDVIHLEKGDYSIDIAYDMFIKRVSEVKKSKVSQIVSTNSNKRRPDILISLFHKGQFIKSMIVEVKYRRLRYIYNSIEETDVMNQLKEYRNLDYYDGNTSKLLQRRPIETVLVVYPSDIESKKTEDIYDFTFISITPRKCKEPLGYNILKNELETFLDF